MDPEISSDDHGGGVATLPRPADPAAARADVGRTAAHRGRAALRFAGPVVVMVLAVKALVFAWGIVARQSLGGLPVTTFADRFSFWNAWDAPHYLSIAQQGYVATGEDAHWIVFFPAYPYAVRFLDVVAPGGLLTSSLLVSGVASIAAALLLAVLVRHDTGDEARAHRAVWFMLIFPTAYFLHLPYTESLFLTFVLGAFVAARTGHWGVAGLVGAFAALTRLNGAILIPALAVEAYLQYRRTGRLDRSWLWIAAIGVGTLIYLGINERVFGDPMHFQLVQDAKWFKHLQDPVSSVSSLAAGLGGQSPDMLPMQLSELVFLGFGLIAGVLAFVWTRASYGVWVVLNVLLFASTSWIQSTPRYALTLFPIFLLLAMIDRQVWLSRLLSAWSIAGLVWFTALFALGRWAF